MPDLVRETFLGIPSRVIIKLLGMHSITKMDKVGGSYLSNVFVHFRPCGSCSDVGAPAGGGAQSRCVPAHVVNWNMCNVCHCSVIPIGWMFAEEKGRARRQVLATNRVPSARAMVRPLLWHMHGPQSALLSIGTSLSRCVSC